MVKQSVGLPTGVWSFCRPRAGNATGLTANRRTSYGDLSSSPPMNTVDSSLAQFFDQLAPGRGVERTYEDDLLGLSNGFSPDEIVQIRASFAQRMRAGDQLSDADVALNDLLPQARTWDMFNRDRARNDNHDHAPR